MNTNNDNGRIRIAVTGMGVVSPIGMGVQAFWSALRRGESGIRAITRFRTDLFSFTRGGEISDFVLPGRLDRVWPHPDRATQFVMVAADEALGDAGISESPCLQDAGLVLATNFGGADSGERVLAGVLDSSGFLPEDFAEYAFQSAADHVARVCRMSGPRAVLSLSCASGTAALAYGCDLIRAGRARVVVTGGYDALSRLAWSGLSALRTMSKDAVRPFDRNRDGTIFSEGAAVLVVEELEHARARGAGIYAEVAGYGVNNNAFHMTAPAKNGAGSASVMAMALKDAGVPPTEVDHVSAHGTGTKPNDSTETAAIRTVFKEHAERLTVTAVKSVTGHMMGAAGSAEAIAAILSIRDGVIPPTMNYRDPDPECDLDYVTNAERRAKVDCVLQNSAGIGGCNAAAVFRRIS